MAALLPRRRRYYAYERHDGSVQWMTKTTHQMLQCYPGWMSRFHVHRDLERTQLMTLNEFKAARR